MQTSPLRRKLAWTFVLSVVVIGGVGGYFLFFVGQSPQPEDRLEVIIEFAHLRDEPGLVISLRDRELIERAVVVPMSQSSRKHPKPKLKVIGRLKTVSKNGSETTIMLLHPWGHYLHDKEYRVADFNELEQSVRSAYRQIGWAVEESNKQ